MHWDWWHSFVRAVTGKSDVSAADAIPEGTEETIQGLREQRFAADQQVRILRRIDRDPDPHEALRRAQMGFPLTRSLRPDLRYDP